MSRRSPRCTRIAPGRWLSYARFFAPKAAPPPQSPRSESLFDFVGRGVHPALLLPILLVEEQALESDPVIPLAAARTSLIAAIWAMLPAMILMFGLLLFR